MILRMLSDSKLDQFCDLEELFLKIPDVTLVGTTHHKDFHTITSSKSTGEHYRTEIRFVNQISWH